jgi:hypothetical protein
MSKKVKVLVIENNPNIEALQSVTYENLLVIATLASVKLHCNYVVTDYSLLKHSKGNRSGINNQRLNTFIVKMSDGFFHADMCLIQVDRNGNIVEGHHRFEIMKLYGIPVKITIVEPKSVAEISDYNSGMNPHWDVVEGTDSASTVGGVTATYIKELRSDLMEKNFLSPKKFMPNELFGVLTKNTKCFSGKKYAPTVRDWLSADEMFGELNTPEFRKNIKNYAKFKRFIRGERDAYKIAKKVMDLHFDKTIDFNLPVLLDALQYSDFELTKVNAKTVEARAMYLYNKEVRNAKTA